MPGPVAVPASHAFDMARRQQAIAAAQQRAQEAQAAKDGAAGKSSGEGSSGASPKSASGAKPDFKDVSRNDTCPCGSGKKFKNCHGA